MATQPDAGRREFDEREEDQRPPFELGSNAAGRLHEKPSDNRELFGKLCFRPHLQTRIRWKRSNRWHRSDIRLIGDPRLADDLPQVRPRRDRRPPDFTGAASVWRLAANGRCHDIPQEQQRLWQRPWNRSRVVLFRHGDGVPRPPLSGPPMAVAPSTVASGSHCGLTANLRLWSARCSTGFRKRRHDPS